MISRAPEVHWDYSERSEYGSSEVEARLEKQDTLLTYILSFQRVSSRLRFDCGFASAQREVFYSSQRHDF